MAEEAMSTRTLFLSRLIGLFCVIAALAMFVRGPAFVDAVTLLLKDPPLMLFVGIVTLGAGLALVLAHNLWSGGPLTVVVTVLGWTSLIKGVLLLSLTPEAEASLFLRGLHYRELFYLYAVLSLALGIYLAYGGFRGRAQTGTT
jgi:hypothetical protein